jgi:hypothetical protein
MHTFPHRLPSAAATYLMRKAQPPPTHPYATHDRMRESASASRMGVPQADPSHHQYLIRNLTSLAAPPSAPSLLDHRN